MRRRGKSKSLRRRRWRPVRSAEENKKKERREEEREVVNGEIS